MNREFWILAVSILMSPNLWADELRIENQTAQPFIHQFYRAHDGSWSESLTIAKGARHEYSTPVPLVIRFHNGSDWVMYHLAPGRLFRCESETGGVTRLFDVGEVPGVAPRAVDAGMVAEEEVKRLKAVVRNRCLAAHEELEALQASYHTGVATLGELILAQIRWLEAALDLCETPAQRIAICQQHVSATRAVYAAVYAKYRVGGRGGGQADESQARQNLLIAEIQLVRERAKARETDRVPSVLVPHCDPRERSAIAAVEAMGGRVYLASEVAGAHAVRLEFPYADSTVLDVPQGPWRQLFPWEKTPSPANLPPPSEPKYVPPDKKPSSPVPASPPIPSAARIDATTPAQEHRPAPELELAIPSANPTADAPPVMTHFSPPIPETVMQQIAELKSLRSADFSRVTLTDADVGKLTTLHDLRELAVAGEITDAGLTHLLGLSRIERLSVKGSYTDAGLASLGKLPTLRSLHVESPHISVAGVDGLRRVLPQTKIETLEKPRALPDRPPTIGPPEEPPSVRPPEARKGGGSL